MSTIGDYIGSYRILWKQDSAEASEHYLVERASVPGTTYLLQFWSTFSIAGRDGENIFASQMLRLRQLHDPLFLPLIDAGIDRGGHPYLVFPEATMRRKSLAVRLHDEKVNEEEARKILLEAGTALALAHQHEIIHGCFSAASILFADDGQLQVYSFLSSALDRGTAQTSSPDQYHYPESKASRLSDQYALATLARELLLAQGNLSEQASQAITRAQAALPEERFPSIRAFLHQPGIELLLAPDEKELAGSSEKTEPFAQEEPAGTTTEKNAGTTKIPPQPGKTYRSGRTTTESTPAQRRGCLIALVCILLIPLLLFLHAVLPASGATVTIAPVDQKFHQDYHLEEASTTNLAAKQFGGRALTYSPKTRTKSVHVTDNTHIDGTPARGKVVFSQLSGTIDLSLYDLSLQVNDNVELIVDDTLTTMEPGHTYIEPVYAEENGTQGNLPAGYVNDTYIVDNGVTAFVANPEQLQGGVNDYDGPIVTSVDVNPAESDLLTQQQLEARTFFQAQLQPGEVLLANLDCQQTNTVNPPLNSRVSNTTVKSSAVCTVEAYDQDQLNTALADAAKKVAQQTFDPHIELTHPVTITITDTGNASTTVRSFIRLSVDSEWRLLLDASGQKAMQQALSGLSQDDASALLRNHYKSRSTILSLNWFWGGHLPIDTASIQIVAHFFS